MIAQLAHQNDLTEPHRANYPCMFFLDYLLVIKQGTAAQTSPQ